MAMPGFAGQVLYVNLSNGEIRSEPLDPALPERFIGGDGVNSRLAYDLIPPRIDPLAPENCIIIGAGPFIGTNIPGSAKIMITTKFPLSGGFATASGGGAFALMMKTAGYDHVVISGRSPRPVYLKIGSDKVEICDATDLWGRDNFETVDALRAIHEPCSVIPIGPAGEHLVKLSITSIDKGGTVGRGGLPAVMGAKKLKAIVACGTGEVQVADRHRLEKMVNPLIERIMKWPGRETVVNFGMAGTRENPESGVAQANKNWTEFKKGDPQAASVPGKMLEIHLGNRQPLACPSCPIADKDLVRVKEGVYAGMVTYMTHFTPHYFGSLDPMVAYGRSIKFSDTLNRYGIDSSTFTGLIQYVTSLYDQGLLTKAETGGVTPHEDFDTVMQLLHMTAYREGFGDLLAEGFTGIAKRVGRGAEKQAVQNKGLGQVYDPRLRGLGTMEFEQIVGFRGAHVASGGSPSYGPGRSNEDFSRHAERMGASPDLIQRAVEENGFDPGHFTRISENWFSLFNSLSLCNRAFLNRFWHIKSLAEFHTVVTGRETTPEALIAAAERVWTLGKLLNVRAGFTRADDQPPEAWFTPIKGDETEYPLRDYYRSRVLTREDFDHYLDEYYDERGWDIITGVPTKEALARVGLSDLAPN